MKKRRKIKIYEKEYEDVFSSPFKNIVWDNLSNDLWLTNYQYIQRLREFWVDMYLTLFDLMVKLMWLNLHFKYNKKWFWRIDKNHYRFSRSMFWILSRKYIWIDFSVITGSFFPTKVASYFHDFFPLFYQEDPFENPNYYKFPYNNITVDFLMLVYQMPERLLLLDIAEKGKMTYADFSDYVINYVYCYNEEHWKQIYNFMDGIKSCPNYIRYNYWQRLSKKNARKQLWRSLNL